MPKVAVEEAVCDICGVDVREGSLFCYNCGGSVTNTEAAAPATTEPIPSTDTEPKNGKADYDPAKRRSERLEKRKVRSVESRQIEIVWEPRTGPSWPFIISSLVFFLIAVVVILAAFYLQ